MAQASRRVVRAMPQIAVMRLDDTPQQKKKKVAAYARVSHEKTGHGTKLSAFVDRHLPDAAAMSDILSARFLYDPKFAVKINGRNSYAVTFFGYTQCVRSW